MDEIFRWKLTLSTSFSMINISKCSCQAPLSNICLSTASSHFLIKKNQICVPVVDACKYSTVHYFCMVEISCRSICFVNNCQIYQPHNFSGVATWGLMGHCPNVKNLAPSLPPTLSEIKKKWVFSFTKWSKLKTF